MHDLENAKSLLSAARRDANALHATAELALVSDEVFGFLAQQALEKTLKAWISILGLAYPFTHNLASLLNILDIAGVDIRELIPLSAYNPFAVELRYSSLTHDEPPLDRAESMAQVDSLLARVDSLYSSIARADS